VYKSSRFPKRSSKRRSKRISTERSIEESSKRLKNCRERIYRLCTLSITEGRLSQLLNKR
jgi:hypothetical protein